MYKKYFSVISVLTLFLLPLILPVNSESIKYGEVCRSPKNHSGHSHDSSHQESEEWSDLEIVSNYCDFGNGVCIDNKCQCELPNMIYNDRLCQCGVPTNSYCSSQVPCLSGNICENNVCICPPPSKPLMDGSCSGGIYAICQRDSDCSPDLFLSCIEGTCYCKNTRLSVFEPDSEFTDDGCKIRAGESCSPGGQKCVSNSKCIQGENNQYFFCRCHEGYLSTSGGICLKDYDQSCISGLHECNENRGLTCTNDTCQCIDSDTFYDKTMSMCVTYVGKLCGNTESLFGGDDYNIGCVQSAECTSDSAVVDFKQNMRNVCNCKVGFEPERIEGKTCVKIPLKEIT